MDAAAATIITHSSYFSPGKRTRVLQKFRKPQKQILRIIIMNYCVETHFARRRLARKAKKGRRKRKEKMFSVVIFALKCPIKTVKGEGRRGRKFRPLLIPLQQNGWNSRRSPCVSGFVCLRLFPFICVPKCVTCFLCSVCVCMCVLQCGCICVFVSYHVCMCILCSCLLVCLVCMHVCMCSVCLCVVVVQLFCEQ